MGFELTINDLPRYTYQDYEKWEGDWELIKGFPYSILPSPTWQHQSFGAEFVSKFISALNDIGLKESCKVLYSCDWIVNEDTVVRPDVMIVCEPIEGKYPTKPPSMILEILSPATILKDRNTKYNLYQAYGVKYYIIANPDKKEIEIFLLEGNQYKLQTQLSTFHLTGICTVEVDVYGLIF
jgi:Uma2 family endonuclease